MTTTPTARSGAHQVSRTAHLSLLPTAEERAQIRAQLDVLTAAWDTAAQSMCPDPWAHPDGTGGYTTTRDLPAGTTDVLGAVLEVVHTARADAAERGWELGRWLRVRVDPGAHGGRRVVLETDVRGADAGEGMTP